MSDVEPMVYGPRAKSVARAMKLSVGSAIEPGHRYVLVADSDSSVTSALDIAAKGIPVAAVVAWDLGPAQVARLTRVGLPTLVGIPTQPEWEQLAVDPRVVEALIPMEERMTRSAT